jgi:RNA polymerase sigma-70 factor (family 1)
MTAKEFEQITISALRNGNIDSYCLCYDIYFKVLCSYANSILHDPLNSEEIVQNLFLEIWQNREKLPENTSLRAYLLTAVKNDCIDHIKHLRIEKQYAEEYIKTTPEHYDNIFDDLIEKDLQVFVQAAIDKLSERCREVFMLSRFHYMSYREIAEKLGTSVKTVENQITTALKTLRAELEQIL